MSRTHVTAILVVSVLAVPASTVFPQAMAPSGVPTTGRQGRVGDNLATCQAAAGGSRMRSNCEAQDTATTVRTEQTLKISLDPPPQLSAAQCAASATTNYYQSNTTARVEGTINIKNCTTGSSGTYTTVVRVRDEKSEINSLEFSDKWQRSDGAQDVKFAADYPIGQNVDLVSVRVRDLRCTCGDPPADSAPVPPGPAPDPSKKD
jgi:hypothetical protein